MTLMIAIYQSLITGANAEYIGRQSNSHQRESESELEREIDQVL